MSLEDLEIRKHTAPLSAELDRQKEKAAAFKLERDAARDVLVAMTAERDGLRIDLEQAAKVTEQLRAEREDALQSAHDHRVAEHQAALRAQTAEAELAATEQLLTATQAERAVDVERAMERIKELETAVCDECDGHTMKAERDAAVSEAKALRRALMTTSRDDEPDSDPCWCTDHWRGRLAEGKHTADCDIARAAIKEATMPSESEKVRILREALARVLMSAHPNPDEHPSMTRAWKLGDAALAATAEPATRDEAAMQPGGWVHALVAEAVTEERAVLEDEHRAALLRFGEVVLEAAIEEIWATGEPSDGDRTRVGLRSIDVTALLKETP